MSSTFSGDFQPLQGNYPRKLEFIDCVRTALTGLDRPKASLGPPPSIVLHEFEFFFDFLEGFRRKTAFAIGEKLFADVGAFGPGPEILFLLLGGIGLLEGKPGAVEHEPFSKEVATTQAGDIGGDFAGAKPAGGLI